MVSYDLGKILNYTNNSFTNVDKYYKRTWLGLEYSEGHFWGSGI